MNNEDLLILPVLRGLVLGVKVYRGFARLCDLAAISKADIYDQRNNPKGTQRDLSPKHAREAYEYVVNQKLAFWPEVFLCARNSSVVSYTSSSDSGEFGTLKINAAKIDRTTQILISRVDGNHRLHYADGQEKGFEPIESVVSFCLAYDSNLDQEIKLFRDINNNQRRMSTSHLDNIMIRLTPEEKLKIQEPELYIAKELGKDAKSPLCNTVYEGGKRSITKYVPLRSLKTAITYMFTKAKKLTALQGVDAQYKVIRNYLNAVKKWQSDAWQSPKDYILLRGVGLWAMFFIGADVIDRALSQGEYTEEELFKILSSGKAWDWSNDGDFKGLSGRKGAIEISNQVTSELMDKSGFTVKSLYNKIMNE